VVVPEVDKSYTELTNLRREQAMDKSDSEAKTPKTETSKRPIRAAEDQRAKELAALAWMANPQQNIPFQSFCHQHDKS
jgi:hypothetical protein